MRDLFEAQPESPLFDRLTGKQPPLRNAYPFFIQPSLGTTIENAAEVPLQLPGRYLAHPCQYVGVITGQYRQFFPLTFEQNQPRHIPSPTFELLQNVPIAINPFSWPS